MLPVLLFSVLICGTFSYIPTGETPSLFAEFVQKYNKVYATQDEYAKRLSIFDSNLALSSQLNEDGGSAVFGITKFMDLTPEEFRAQRLMQPGMIVHQEDHYVDVNKADALPTSFNWENRGAVTPVKDQKQCGSCWAFSATEAIESQWFLAGHKLPILAPQQIVDCDKRDHGCNGGNPTTAYDYVIGAGGQDTEAAYPYHAKDEKCEFKPGAVGAKIKSWTYITKNRNETEMAEKLVKSGPLSICVDASSWQHYKSGVVRSNCGQSLDHCVMITGFRDETVNGKSVPIWLVRNSWGADWGEKGFIWIERNKNLCGLADEVTIPLVE